MSKNKPLKFVVLALFALQESLIAVETSSAVQISKAISVSDLLGKISNLAELKNFTQDDYDKRTNELSVAPDLKSTPAGGGFAITVPRKAAAGQIDSYTLKSILKLKGGSEPEGFIQFWTIYAADASKLGYLEIKEAFAAVEAAQKMKYTAYNLLKLNNSNAENKSVEELSVFYEITMDQAQQLSKILEVLPKINGVARTMGEMVNLSKMTIEKAREWYEGEYTKKNNEYTQEYEDLNLIVNEFIRKYQL